MDAFNLEKQQWDPKRHRREENPRQDRGAITVACWEPPDQPVPLPSAPRDRNLFLLRRRQDAHATETIDVVPGAFVVHPPGEECTNTSTDRAHAPIRVRYSGDSAPARRWRGHPISSRARMTPNVPEEPRVATGPRECGSFSLIAERKSKRLETGSRKRSLNSRILRSVAWLARPKTTHHGTPQDARGRAFCAG